MQPFWELLKIKSSDGKNWRYPIEKEILELPVGGLKKRRVVGCAKESLKKRRGIRVRIGLSGESF